MVTIEAKAILVDERQKMWSRKALAIKLGISRSTVQMGEEFSKLVRDYQASIPSGQPIGYPFSDYQAWVVGIVSLYLVRMKKEYNGFSYQKELVRFLKQNPDTLSWAVWQETINQGLQ